MRYYTEKTEVFTAKVLANMLGIFVALFFWYIIVFLGSVIAAGTCDVQVILPMLGRFVMQYLLLLFHTAMIQLIGTVTRNRAVLFHPFMYACIGCVFVVNIGCALFADADSRIFIETEYFSYIYLLICNLAVGSIPANEFGSTLKDRVLAVRNRTGIFIFGKQHCRNTESDCPGFCVK